MGRCRATQRPVSCPPPLFQNTTKRNHPPPQCVYHNLAQMSSDPNLATVRLRGDQPEGQQTHDPVKPKKKKKVLSLPRFGVLEEDSRPLATSPLHDGHAEGARLTNQTPIVRGTEQIMTIVVHLETDPQGFFTTAAAAHKLCPIQGPRRALEIRLCMTSLRLGAPRQFKTLHWNYGSGGLFCIALIAIQDFPSSSASSHRSPDKARGNRHAQKASASTPWALGMTAHTQRHAKSCAASFRRPRYRRAPGR